ncbi:MAG: chromate efflux transporter [Spirochaetia bacterium]|jgi:chromate transporter
MRAKPLPTEPSRAGAILEVLGSSFKLGLTSFGGPVAHLGYLREEYVIRRKWLREDSFADLVALCQFLPGPASSQVNMSIGMSRAGIPGGLAAWLGFTLPSAAVMTGFAFLLGVNGVLESGWLHGIMLAAVAVVAQAVGAMAARYSADATRAAMTAVAAIASLLLPSGLTQVALIAAGGIAGRLLLPAQGALERETLPLNVSRPVSLIALGLFFALLAGLPLLRAVFQVQWLSLFESFYRTGSLVFGGGHVVLPLLHREVVLPGWVSDSRFMAGYAAAQAVPGPLFTFAAYLGAVATTGPGGVWGALIALAAIFLPSFLLLLGVLPFWNTLRKQPGFQSALSGINAAVVGLLAAALYQPVWTSAVFTVPDFCIALGAFVLLTRMSARPWMVVALGAAAGAGMRLVS